MRRESRARLGRLFTIGTVIVAWFALSNHCALAAITTPPAAPVEGCPMHAERGAPKPPQDNNCDGALACCKTLRAVATKSAKTNRGQTATVSPPQFQLVEATVALVLGAPASALPLDTGPPGSRTFAELILQRSLLAHAPPSQA